MASFYHIFPIARAMPSHLTMNVHRCRFVDYTPATILLSCFTEDGRYVVGRSNGQIEIWDPEHWTHLVTIPGTALLSVEGICAADSRLFTVGGSTSVTEWDVNTWRPKSNYDCNAGVVWCVDANPQGTRLAAGCDDGLVVILSIEGGVIEYQLILQRQDLRVMLIKWVNDDIVIGGCADGRIRSWSVAERGRMTATMRVDKSKTELTLVWLLCVLPNQSQFVLGDSTGQVKFWDVKSMTLLQSFNAHDADVLALAVSGDGTKVFTAGVDRKIHQFTLVELKKLLKWSHLFNRLLHANDVRTLAIHDDWLVLGGIERSIVVLLVKEFLDGEYKKFTVDQQIANTVVYNNFVALFSDQTVKVWRIGTKPLLVAKVVINAEENITLIDLSDNFLAVSTINAIKVFAITDTGAKLEITKVKDSQFEDINPGAKYVKWVGSQLVAITAEEEIYRFNITKDLILLDVELETLGLSLPLRQVVVLPDNERVVVLRHNGDLEVYYENSGRRLTRIARGCQMTFTGDDRLAVYADNGSIKEVFVAGSQLLTPWLNAHRDMPPRFVLLTQDAPVEGCFALEGKLWVYGTLWLAYFDLLLMEAMVGKKRSRNGNVVDVDAKLAAFLVTQKYRPIIKAAPLLALLMVVVERPLLLLPTTEAYAVPKIQL